jgi:hypothetical protein
MICHDRPYLSFSQPHRCFSPPAESFSHGDAVAKLVDAADQNAGQLSAAAEGLGQAVNISA